MIPAPPLRPLLPKVLEILRTSREPQAFQSMSYRKDGDKGEMCFCAQGLLIHKLAPELFPEAEPGWEENTVHINWYHVLTKICYGLGVNMLLMDQVERWNDEDHMTFAQIADRIEVEVEALEFQINVPGLESED